MTRIFPAIEFLKHIGAIESEKEFWEEYKELVPIVNDIPRRIEDEIKGDAFITSIHSEAKTRAIYKITHPEREVLQATVVSLLSLYLYAHNPYAKIGIHLTEKLNSIPGFEDYKGHLTTLEPPEDKIPYNLENLGKLKPDYVANKIGQLRKAIKRIQGLCPHEFKLVLTVNPSPKDDVLEVRCIYCGIKKEEKQE